MSLASKIYLGSRLGGQFHLTLCIILMLFVVDVNTESGEDVTSGDDEPLPDGGDDEAIDSDLDYSKLVLCAILFIVALGPLLIYYYSFFYSSRSVGFVRVTSLFYWILFWASVPFTIGCSATHCDLQSKTLYITNLLALICMPFFWLIILIESWISRERELIVKLDKTKPIVSYIQDLKNAPPKITWEVECFHYETKTRRVPYINSDGDTFFREESSKEKVTTHTESQEFQFTYWTDESSTTVEGLKKNQITELQLSKEIEPGDPETSQIMNKKKQEFLDKNKNKDKKIHFVEEKTIPGFEPVFTAYTDESCTSCWIGQPQFWIASFLGLTWPYRLLMWRKTGVTFKKVRKSIFVPHSGNLNVHVCSIPDNVEQSTGCEVQSEDFVTISIDDMDSM